jgi:hypothetical protein
MQVPHRFMTTPDEVKAIETNQRPKPEEDRAILWNMQQVKNPRSNEEGLFDLVWSDDANKGRLIVRSTAPTSGISSRWINRIIEETVPRNLLEIEVEAARAFNKADIQFITQRHADVNFINQLVFDRLFPSLKEQKLRHLRRYERVCCTKNGYFMNTSSEENNGSIFISDTEIERIALQRALRDDLQGAGASPADPSPHDFMDVDGPAPDSLAMRELASSNRKLKRTRPDRDDTMRGLMSDDVFNGDIKMIQRIVDVDRAVGNVVAEFMHVKEGRMRYSPSGKANLKSLNHVARLIIFDDDTQLNISDDYDVADMMRAYCITSKKMQGSQAKIVVNYLTPATAMENDRVTTNTLYREELYTNMTRAENKFFALVPVSDVNHYVMLEALRDIAHHSTPRTHSAFALHMPPPVSSNARD